MPDEGVRRAQVLGVPAVPRRVHAHRPHRRRHDDLRERHALRLRDGEAGGPVGVRRGVPRHLPAADHRHAARNGVRLPGIPRGPDGRHVPGTHERRHLPAASGRGWRPGPAVRPDHHDRGLCGRHLVPGHLQHRLCHRRRGRHIHGHILPVADGRALHGGCRRHGRDRVALGAQELLAARRGVVQEEDRSAGPRGPAQDLGEGSGALYHHDGNADRLRADHLPLRHAPVGVLHRGHVLRLLGRGARARSPRLGEADEAHHLLDDSHLLLLHGRVLHPSRGAAGSQGLPVWVHHGHRPLHSHQSVVRVLHGPAQVRDRLGHGGARRVRVSHCSDGQGWWHDR
mmetsp:Transcript_30213/g.84780  ORF Transcript_30213/g.84780 Transcript_30213/m.84780 type:complete len:341 (-) Transcript_30213:493-1515(-)